MGSAVGSCSTAGSSLPWARQPRLAGRRRATVQTGQQAGPLRHGTLSISVT